MGSPKPMRPKLNKPSNHPTSTSVSEAGAFTENAQRPSKRQQILTIKKDEIIRKSDSAKNTSRNEQED